MSECSCDMCKSACSYKPGWFLPDQIKPLADHLGLTEKELFDNHLMVDYVDLAGPDGNYHGGDEPKVLILSPAIVTHEPGDCFPSDPRGACRWFVEGKCAIHDFKPFECADYDHTKTHEEGMVVHRHIIPKAWQEHHQRVVDLLGYEPQEDVDDIFSFLATMMTSGITRGYTPPAPREVPVDVSWDMEELDYDAVILKAQEICNGPCLVTSVDSRIGLDPTYEATIHGMINLNHPDNSTTYVVLKATVSHDVYVKMMSDLSACRFYGNVQISSV